MRLVLQPLAIAVVAALALRTTVMSFSIPSASMDPTLLAGDHILVTPYDGPLWHSSPRRGDVVVFRHLPDGEILVKRIVAVPAETVEVRNRDILINDKVLIEPWAAPGVDYGAVPPTALGEGRYFVMGDNRLESLDSRAWGPVERSSILGRARVVFWSTSGGTAGGPTAAASTPAPAHAGITPSAIRWNRLLHPIH